MCFLVNNKHQKENATTTITAPKSGLLLRSEIIMRQRDTKQNSGAHGALKTLKPRISQENEFKWFLREFSGAGNWMIDKIRIVPITIFDD